MPVSLSQAARAALVNPFARKVTRLWVINDLPWKSPTLVEVTSIVRKWGSVEKPSTLANTRWTVPHFTPSLINIDGYLTEGNAASLWTSLGKTPRECYVWRVKLVELPDGSFEPVDTYIGKINDAVLRAEGTAWLVDLSTTMAQDELLAAKITKLIGDELVVPYQDWYP